jgi:hypothetical protein
MIVSKETILTQGYKPALNAMQLLAAVDGMEFHTVEAYSGLGLTRVKYNVNKLSRVEKEHVLVRFNPNIFTDWGKIIFYVCVAMKF